MDTLYITAANRSLDYLTDGIYGRVIVGASNTFGLGSYNGTIIALDLMTGKIKWQYQTQTGNKLWEFDVNAPIRQVGPSIGDGILFVPTGKGKMKNTIQGLPKGEKIGGSIVAFGLP
jgi:glucose dehydrogenase